MFHFSYIEYFTFTKFPQNTFSRDFFYNSFFVLSSNNYWWIPLIIFVIFNKNDSAGRLLENSFPIYLASAFEKSEAPSSNMDKSTPIPSCSSFFHLSFHNLVAIILIATNFGNVTDPILEFCLHSLGKIKSLLKSLEMLVIFIFKFAEHLLQ